MKGSKFITSPAFLLLLPIFFVFHGFVENYDAIEAGAAMHLTLVYLLSAIIIALISWLLLRDWRKAAMFSFLVMSFHFFFGTIHDSLISLLGRSFITRYTFILPLALVAFVTVLILLRRSHRKFMRVSKYLNILLILLIIVDISLLLVKATKGKELTTLPSTLIPCKGCPKPDIYFIVLDEYAGKNELEEVFNYRNDRFYDELRKREFIVIDSSNSNYNYTPFSVASTLNMNYLNLKDTMRGGEDLYLSYKLIRDNPLLPFFENHGYEFYNYSVFDFEGKPARTRETFLPSQTKLITAQTFISRAERDIFFNLITRFRSEATLKKVTYHNLNNNNRLLELTKSVGTKAGKPKFIYTHLMMPHYPYYFDSTGQQQPYLTLVEGQQGNQERYISYLKYSNEQILRLLDQIQVNSSNNLIIVLVSDHGFRHFNTPVERKYHFMNLSAVYMPGANPKMFYKGMTNVNLFREMLNQQFGQQLPIHADSSIYLRD